MEALHEEAGVQRARAMGPGGRTKQQCHVRLGAEMVPSWLSTGHQTQLIFLRGFNRSTPPQQVAEEGCFPDIPLGRRVPWKCQWAPAEAQGWD